MGRFPAVDLRPMLGRAVVSSQRRLLRRIQTLPQMQIHAGEVEVLDRVRLHEPEPLSRLEDASEQALYFTGPSLLRGETDLVLINQRTGNPNLYVRHLESGRERPLSDNRDGFLKSYVYFTARPYRGLGVASPSLHPTSGKVYYLLGRQIIVADVDGGWDVLATLPAEQMTGYTSVSADGTRLCVPTVDARALGGDEQLTGWPSYGVARRVRQEGLSSYLRVYSTQDGRELLCEQVPRAWITHVQFSPVRSDWILYNHEWSHHCGVRRMWLWDGREHLPLRQEGDGRDRRDWVCHEFWTADGASILYHGRFHAGREFIGRIRLPAGTPDEIPLPAGWNQYGHYHAIGDGCMVTDGYFRPRLPIPLRHCPWISRLDVDWGGRRIVWTALTGHLSSWATQDDHPHPRLDPSGGMVYFNSDRAGRRGIFRIATQAG